MVNLRKVVSLRLILHLLERQVALLVSKLALISYYIGVVKTLMELYLFIQFGTFLRVKHVMTRHPKCLRTVERAGVIFDILTNTTHNGFPVIVKDPKFGSHCCLV